MPEIAEVRTVARTLNSRIVGRKIIGIDTPYSKIIQSDLKYFKDNVVNRVITGVDNYGKWLFIHLGDMTIISHLRMEGKYFIKDKNDEINKHEHILFHLDDNTDLRYHDTRKFGVMKLINTEDIYKCEEVSKLGYEPDSKDLTIDYLMDKLNNKNMPIKTALLDQTIINGLGNIYVDEVLFLSKIHPLTLAKDLNRNDLRKIIRSCYSIITLATHEGGTTIRSYTSSLGVYGNYQNFLNVHTMKKCKKCNSNIEKIRVGGRGTYYCPKCQKESTK